MSRRGSIRANEVPTEMWAPLARLLIDKLTKAILSLQQGSDKIENFHVVDTRGTLKPPDIDEIGPTRHWLNEIHPSYEGYLKVGCRIELQKLSLDLGKHKPDHRDIADDHDRLQPLGNG